MFITISYSDPEPIFRQVIDQIKTAIANGDLKEEEKLPSIREMSSELKVSTITIKRAYTELESEGFIYTRAGLGSFVTQINRANLKTEKMEDIKAELHKMIHSAHQYDISLEEIKQLIEDVEKEI